MDRYRSENGWMQLIFYVVILLCLVACNLLSDEGGTSIASTTPDTPDGGSTSTPSDPTGLSDLEIPECPDDVNEPLFTVPPVNWDDFLGIVPLGGLNPPSHTFPTDHIYFYIRRSDPADWRSPTASVPVYAPGHVWITAVDSSEHVTAEPPYTDYRIHFAPCRQFQAYFIHIEELAPELLTQVGPLDDDRCTSYETGGQVYRSCEAWGLSIEVEAGEYLGTAGGREGQNALDLGAHDARVPPLEYVNPSRLYTNTTGFDPFHVVCPIDYFESDVREQLRARLGDGSGLFQRTIEPLCGEVEQDEPGTAQGNWYVSGTSEPYPEDPHLALVHDVVDPTIAVFSVGTSIPELTPGRYRLFPKSSGQTNLDFDLVTSESGVICYESLMTAGMAPEASLGLIILLQMTDDVTLQIEKQDVGSCGAGPWSFTSALVEFER